MRVTLIVATYLAAGPFSTLAFAQGPARVAAHAGAAVATTAQAPKFTFILFWKVNDANTQRMSGVLKSSVAKRSDRAGWRAVNVNDGANRALVEQYQLSRVPMPTVLCVAPNGAITGAFVRKISDAAVESALVSATGADVVKALQDKKIVIVHVKPAAQSPLPAGAAAFIADPEFQARTTTVSVVVGDPNESRFFADIDVNTAALNGSMLVVMAPPAALVGKFDANVSKEQLIAQLHAAGKCCDDPNCNHNKKSQ